jgi:general stress protein 26
MKQPSPANLENLTGTPAVDKIRQIAETAGACLFGTLNDGRFLDVRPMAVQKVDDTGGVWFLSGRSSNKNQRLEHDVHVQLLFANPGASEYLSLTGRASVSDDRGLREQLWTSAAKTWFPGGVDDPDLTVICVQVDGGHYWNAVHGKAVALAKMAAGAITGRNANVGIEGAVRP